VLSVLGDQKLKNLRYRRTRKTGIANLKYKIGKGWEFFFFLKKLIVKLAKIIVLTMMYRK